MERLHYDDAQRDLGRGRPCSAKRRFKAEERLRNAYYMLRNRSIRAQTHAQITRSGPATTRRTRCPIDIKALESYANSPAGNTVFRSQKKHQQVLVGKTVRTVINDFLSHVSSSPNDPDTGFIDIEYTYGKRTSALVATGWITGGREYAKNADPFKLPKFLRNRALCRFGYDFDDSCSYPRAAFRAIRFHAHLAGILVRNREEIMEKIGLLIFSTTKTDVERRKLIKHLINLLDMDGSYAGWRAIHNIPLHLTLGDEGGDGPILRLNNGGIFPVRQYFKQQPQRAE